MSSVSLKIKCDVSFDFNFQRTMGRERMAKD